MMAVTTDEAKKLWQLCLDELALDIDEGEMSQWLLPLQAQLDDDTLVLIAINSFFVKHINKNYLDKIIELVKKYSQGAINVVRVQMSTPTVSVPIADNTTKKHKTSTRITESDSLNDDYTFDAFVRAKSNNMAHSACYDMGKKAGDSAYKSIFIHGVSGIGKTHLMQAVAHRYQKAGRKFCYFTADSFMARTSVFFRNKNIDEFKQHVKQAELLIIDDVHLMPNKNKPIISSLMLELYNEFTQNGKRVILASDRMPHQMEDFDPRFLSRFSEGLTVGIDPPEMETRVQILEKKAASEQMKLILPKECAIFIAQNVPPDVRRLEGALNQVKAAANLEGSNEVDMALVRQSLKNLIVARARSVNSESIKSMVAEYFSISVKDMVGKKRVRHIARPRQIAMALVREFTNDSFPEIGQAFGGRDHTTVMHACEKVAELRQEDPTFEKDYMALSSTLEFF